MTDEKKPKPRRTKPYTATTSAGRVITIDNEAAKRYMRGLDRAIKAAERASAEPPAVESKLTDPEKDAALVKLRNALRAMDPPREGQERLRWYQKADRS